VIYSKVSPSRRYLDLLYQYSALHSNGESRRGFSAEETYPGTSLLPHCRSIRELIEKTGATTILDYGSGKGIAYELSPIDIPGHGRAQNLLDYWDVDSVHCFDPCYPPYAKPPQGQFSGVVCTDVLEHCPEEDLGWIVRELFMFADRFVFASIACYPALTHLPNGENAHLTIREPQWWEGLFAAAAQDRPQVGWRIVTDGIEVSDPNAIRRQRFGTV
jgi:hypothetical protein